MLSPSSASYMFSREEGLQLRVRHEGRNLVIPAPIDPYFFVASRHEAVVRYYSRRKGIPIRVESTDLKALSGEPVVKVEVEQPRQVSSLREAMPIPTYEADIPFVRRVMIDEDWHPPQRYRKLYFDIECREGRVVCIAFSGERGRVEVLRGEEEEVLRGFLESVGDVDMVLGYNSSNYDVPVLEGRLRQYKMELPDMQRWHDLLPTLRWLRQRMLPDWSLTWVGKNLVGVERVHVDKPFSQLTLDEVCERCRRDVEITLELDRKLGLSEVDIMKAHLSYIFPDEAIYVSRCIDSLLLRRARELGYVLPNKPRGNSAQRHSGAFVAQPPQPLRIYRNVLFLDCVSLYPSIMIGLRISPDPEGELYPSLLRRLMEERLRYKRLLRETGSKQYEFLQQACKVVANAMYGVVSAPGFRVQRPDLGDEVARRGREIVTSLMDFYRGLGYEVVAADTDSCALADVMADEEAFRMLAEAGSRHVRDRFGLEVQVEPEKFYSQLYFLRRAGDPSAAKKRYVGYLSWTPEEGWLETPELDMVGVEYVRSDYPPAAQELQRRLIEGYLSGRSAEELRSILLEFRGKLFSGRFPPEDLAISKSLAQRRYRVTPPHVRAAEKLREMGVPVGVGDKVRFLYTRSGPIPLELYRGEELDLPHYWGNIFERVAERTLGITLETRLDTWMETRGVSGG